jgi:chromosome segregation ATPase
MDPIFETNPKKESPPVPEVPVHPLPPLSTVVQSTPTHLGPDLPTPPLPSLPEDSEMLMRSLVLRIQKLESQHKTSNNFIQNMYSQQQVMQAENIALDADSAVLKKDTAQVNSERIRVLANLKELSRESIDATRTVTEELQSSLLALQMDHDSLLLQIRVTEDEIQELRSRFAALEAHALSVSISTFSDQDRSRLSLLEFKLKDSAGAFKKLEHKLPGLSNKLEYLCL